MDIEDANEHGVPRLVPSSTTAQKQSQLLHNITVSETGNKLSGRLHSRMANASQHVDNQYAQQ
ncbi:hypothetical protein Tdes44962_MAKER09514 [Teratosphaeria destructans]|uniref:Uncharacterized protein n=1 Tax=Teratosphaeria destructans TaxID=418781 RepID=A0A9W7SSW1_9PEZI|nr:hypothetical protein Tdes44962_MAKER09514 [Teratosphaeria destructans]